jgi:hypothetical protein
MIIYFGAGNFDWNKNFAYFSAKTPFQRITNEDICDETFGLAIHQTELVMNRDIVGYFGIHIPSVKKRINQIRGEEFTPVFKLDDIEQFIIQVSDIEEVLAMDQNTLYTWR